MVYWQPRCQFSGPALCLHQIQAPPGSFQAITPHCGNGSTDPFLQDEGPLYRANLVGWIQKAWLKPVERALYSETILNQTSLPYTFIGVRSPLLSEGSLCLLPLPLLYPAGHFSQKTFTCLIPSWHLLLWGFCFSCSLIDPCDQSLKKVLWVTCFNIGLPWRPSW